MSETIAKTPDWNDPASVCRWYGGELLAAYETMGRGQRPPTRDRLRSLSQSLDTWQKLYRLASETSELSELRSELDALRAQVENGGGLRAIK